MVPSECTHAKVQRVEKTSSLPKHGCSRAIGRDHRAVAALLGGPEEGDHHRAARHVAERAHVLAVALQQAHAALGVPVRLQLQPLLLELHGTRREPAPGEGLLQPPMEPG